MVAWTMGWASVSTRKSEGQRRGGRGTGGDDAILDGSLAIVDAAEDDSIHFAFREHGEQYPASAVVEMRA